MKSNYSVPMWQLLPAGSYWIGKATCQDQQINQIRIDITTGIRQTTCFVNWNQFITTN